MHPLLALLGSIRFKVPLAMVLVTTGLTWGLLHLYEQRFLEVVHDGEVEAARALLSMAEAVREEVDDRWDSGLYSPASLRAVMADSTIDPTDRLVQARATVPIMNAWRIARHTAEDGDFQFRPLRRGARNPAHEPTGVEIEALDAFAADPSLEEWWVRDAEAVAIRYFRPVRLTESCLVCHGDPATSDELWGRGDGKDLFGMPMEGKRVGDLHGAFEIVRSVETAEAALASEIADARQIGWFITIAVALIVLFLLEFLVGRPLSRRVEGMRHAETSQDLSFRLPAKSPSTEIRTMSRAFNGFLDPFHQGLLQVVRAVSGVVNDSTRVANISNETFSAADRQTVETQQLAGAMEEFTITSSEMAETAARTRTHTESAEKAADDGRAVVSEVGRAIEGLAREVQSSADVVIALNEQAEKIGSVVDVIRSIADQTGLLALNAAIEAARAGESGAGFAVVADEVRALAHRTQESTNEIQQIVDEVTESTTRAASAMRSSHEMATESVEKSRRATSALDAIANANREIADAAATIATAAQEQRDVTSQMAESITSITRGARSMCDGATETRESTVRIVAALADLESMVRRFNLGETRFDQITERNDDVERSVEGAGASVELA